MISIVVDINQCQHDFFFTEFTEKAWIHLCIVEALLFLISFGLIFAMVQLNLEQTPKKESKTMYSFRISLTLFLRAIINKGLSLKTKSQSL